MCPWRLDSLLVELQEAVFLAIGIGEELRGLARPGGAPPPELATAYEVHADYEAACRGGLLALGSPHAQRIINLLLGRARDAENVLLTALDAAEDAAEAAMNHQEQGTMHLEDAEE